MPSTFLTTALLAEQSEVDAILGRSLDDDADETGQARLARVLSSLARDPRVLTLLTAAEKEVARAFTPQGKRRHTRSSPLALALAEVDRLGEELEERNAARDEAEQLEASARALEEKWKTARAATEAAEAKLRTAEQRATRGDDEASRALVEEADAALTAHDELAKQRRQLDTTRAGAQHEHAEREREAVALRARHAAAQAQVQALDAAERDAKSSKDGAKKALAKSELEGALAKGQLRRAELTKQLEAARTASEAKTLASEQERLAAQLAQAKETLEAQRAEVELTTGITAYGQWRKAMDERERTDGVQAELVRARAALESARTGGAATKQELDALTAQLPDAKQLEAIKTLRRDLDLAEAALGGGVTVVLKPRSDVRVRLSADDGPFDEFVVKSGERVVDVERRAALQLGDFLDLDVTAGAPDKRRDVEHLKKRWKAEALPALERAELRTVKELDARLERVAELRARHQSGAADLARLEESVRQLEARVRNAPSDADLEARKQRIGRLPLDVLAQHFASLKNWEVETSALHQKATGAFAQTSALVAKLEGELKLVSHRLLPAERGEGRKSAELRVDEVAVKKELARLDAELEGLSQRLADVTKPAAADGLPAQTRKAKEELTRAAAALETAEAALAAAQQQLHALQGELKALDAQLAKPSRAKLVEKLEQAKAKLSAAQSKESSAELKQLRRAASEARSAAEKAAHAWSSALGGLERVGGAAVHDRLEETRLALARARREAERLSVDADGWRLLQETVSSAEKELTSNLGQALSEPVTRAFAELTRGRYGTVRFDSSLRAQGVEVGGLTPDDAIAALSVGTRDNLATLVRLALATHLTSPVVLDDHLVHSDLSRLSWFRQALAEAALKTQVIVITCRPLDYLTAAQLPKPGQAMVDRDGLRVIDLEQLITKRP